MKLVCPNCRGAHVEWLYVGEPPPYLTCGGCDRVIPSPAWELYEWSGLSGKVQKIRPPVVLADWDALEGVPHIRWG